MRLVIFSAQPPPFIFRVEKAWINLVSIVPNCVAYIFDRTFLFRFGYLLFIHWYEVNNQQSSPKSYALTANFGLETSQLIGFNESDQKWLQHNQAQSSAIQISSIGNIQTLKFVMEVWALKTQLCDSKWGPASNMISTRFISDDAGPIFAMNEEEGCVSSASYFLHFETLEPEKLKIIMTQLSAIGTPLTDFQSIY